MTALIVDQTMLELLRQVKEPTEIRDKSGSVLGVFSPADSATTGAARRKLRTKEEEAALLEELERRAKDPGPDRTFRQAFERLLSLATDPAQRNLIQDKID